MGLLGGDPIPWRRWWLPTDAEPTLFDGLLPDPLGQYTRYINSGAVLLEETAAARARVLLADGGMGKSTEVLVECDRLQASGEHAALIDLGAYASTGEITGAIDNAVAEWKAKGSPGDLVLVLDGYDEPLVDVANLADVLARALGALDRESLRVVVASRGSLWSDRLQANFATWWGQDEVVVLHLAPLTERDVALAARSANLDGDAFVEAVRTADAGPLAARPITLRLMLAGAREAKLPTSRLAAYENGVAALAVEPGPRRRERRRTGAPLERRLSAARRLAAASVLSGRPTIVRRRTPEQRSSELALDDVATAGLDLDALDDVFDSALLSGAGTARAWCHHSVAEHLCGQALAALPAAAAWTLLAAPGDPSVVRPQLEETAAWAAVINDDLFDRLVRDNPRVLVKADLAARPAEDRERLGRALLARLAGDDPVLDRASAAALDYPGVQDDLRPLLAPGQPLWRRRETVILTAVARQRADLDDALLDIVREASGKTGHDEHITLCVYAALALERTEDPDVLAAMRDLAADPAVNLRVRAALVTALFPARLSGDDVAALFTAEQRRSQPLGRNIVHALQRAVDDNAVPAADLIAWFDMPDGAAMRDERERRLAAESAFAVVAEGPGHPRWEAAVRVARSLLRDHVRRLDWHHVAVDALGPERRQAFARAVLHGRADDSMANDLLDLRVLRADDLLWWLDRLDEDAAGGGDGGLSAGAAVRVLLHTVDDDAVLSAARARCEASPSLAASVGADITPDAIDKRRDWRAMAEQRRLARERQHATYLFSADRLDQALGSRELAAALDELDRTPAPDARPPGPNGPTTAWTTASEEARQRLADLAAARLTGDAFDLDNYDDIHLLAASIDVVAAASRDRLEAIPLERWPRWLPALLRAHSGTAVQTCLARALRHDPDGVADTAEAVLVKHAAGTGLGLPDWLIDALPPHITDRLAETALQLARPADIPASALACLLAAANAGRPAESAEVALEHVERRGTAPSDGPRNPDAPDVAAWTRALAAARALIANPGPHDAFDRLFAAFEQDPGFAVEAVRTVGAWQSGAAWKALTADELARLYLWARSAMPARNPPPGVTLSTDRAEELPDDLIRMLTEGADADAVAALRGLATATGNVYLGEAATRLAAQVAADAAEPPSPDAILQVLDDPHRRVVTTRAQLAEVVLEELDALADDYSRDRGRRRRLWERQRQWTDWSGTWVPAEETRVSQELKAELAERLRGRVAVVREVEIQPRLGEQSADLPDVLAIALTTDTVTIDIPLEVKGNYNPDVVEALTTQLADRYLAGPAGTEGVYVVASFGLEGWDAEDKKRRAIAARHSPDELRALLEREAAAAAARGNVVHVRVIEIPLADNT